MVDVTVIIPVHNVEQYLERCLDSLIEQDYDKKKMEIFVIDDGSTDRSVDILKKYERIYSFITAKYLEENRGVSNARNIGIRECKGEYIVFCDADDYYEKNSISIFMKEVKQRNADVVIANYFISNDNKSIKVNTTKYFSKDQIKKEEIISYMTLTSCSKIVKKELFIKNNIYYPTDIKRCEELTVIPVVAYLAQNPVAIDETLYHYYQRKTSASNNNTRDSKVENLECYDKTFEIFSRIIDNDKYKEEIEFRTIEHLFYSKILVMFKSEADKIEITNEIKKFKKKYPQFLKNKYLKRYNKAKIIFIKLLNYKMLFLAKIFVDIHAKLTG